MSQITIQFSSQNDLGSDAIKLFEHGGSYSHVDAILPDGSLLGARSDVCLGVPAGVQVRPSSYANFATIKSVMIPCAEAQMGLFYDFLHAQIGKPYDETAILGFVFDRDWRDTDSFFCAELIALAMERSGIFKYALSAPANKITPTDLLLACSVLIDVGA